MWGVGGNAPNPRGSSSPQSSPGVYRNTPGGRSGGMPWRGGSRVCLAWGSGLRSRHATKCDCGIEEVREAGRVGAVAPFQLLVSDSRRTRCRFVQGFGKVRRDFFGGDGGEAPAVYRRKGVIREGGIGFRTVGKNLSDRTCLISVVEVAREPSIFKSDGMRYWTSTS